jgi:hypothetical protein
MSGVFPNRRIIHLRPRLEAGNSGVFLVLYTGGLGEDTSANKYPWLARV